MTNKKILASCAQQNIYTVMMKNLPLNFVLSDSHFSDSKLSASLFASTSKFNLVKATILKKIKTVNYPSAKVQLVNICITLKKPKSVYKNKS